MLARESRVRVAEGGMSKSGVVALTEIASPLVMRNSGRRSPAHQLSVDQ
jgi:hypothetical protein